MNPELDRTQHRGRPARGGAVDLSVLARDRAHTEGPQPFLTFYDGATGERTELSHTTFENWTAKAANLLVDELELEPGARCGLRLGSHWTTVVLAVACWRAGVEVVLGEADADAWVTGEGENAPSAAPALVVGDGFGGRALGDVGGALVFGDEVLAQPDDFPDADPGGDAAALDASDGGRWTHAELVAVVEQPPLLASRRLASTLPVSGPAGLVCGPVSRLVHGGALVLITATDATGTARHCADERVDALIPPPDQAAQAAAAGVPAVHAVTWTAAGPKFAPRTSA